MDDELEIEVELTPEAEVETEEFTVASDVWDANLAADLPQDMLFRIGSDRLDTYMNHNNARADWIERIKEGVRFLGIGVDDPPDWLPEGTCTAVHPLLMENVVKFQAKAIQELWPAKGPVRTRTKMGSPPEAEQIAERIRAFMNYQLTEQVPGFYHDMEQNLFRIGFLGTGIRKIGWNSAKGVPDPVIVPVENLLVDPSITHLRHQDEYIERMDQSSRVFKSYVESGLFIASEHDTEETLELDEVAMALAEAQGFDTVLERKGYTVAESHCYLNLEGADPLVPVGRSAPYVVHFNYKTGAVYSIKRNWSPGDPTFEKRVWYTVDRLIPAFGFYGLGFLHLIGDLAAASTTTLRALVDAGIMANFQGGYKLKDLKIADDGTPLRFGEWRDVESGMEDLQKAFYPVPAKEPSATLYQMLQFIVNAGQKFADTTDQVVQDSTNYGPVATTLALLEASQRFYNSIHKRLHQSQQEFFKLLALVNRENLPPMLQFAHQHANGIIYASDFDTKLVDILPASDPNAMTESQRIAKAQIELEMAARFPQLHNLPFALKRFYRALGAEDIDQLVPDPEQDAVSADPLTEIQLAMRGKPIKAQLGQQHEAHIAVKEAFLQQPQMQGPGDPSIAVGRQLLMSNVAEHKTLMFVAQVLQAAQQLGLPPQDERVQAAISLKLLEASAAQGGAVSVEQQMVELEKRQLDQADARLAQQAVVAAAKIEKDKRDLDLKVVKTLAELKQKNDQQTIEVAEKLLDYTSQKSHDDAERLSALAARFNESRT